MGHLRGTYESATKRNFEVRLTSTILRIRLLTINDFRGYREELIALAHDILITAGVFSLLGHFYGVEVGIPFIAALLTILGFSVHDTIVVYDRTRENLLKGSSKEAFPDVVNRSLNDE